MKLTLTLLAALALGAGQLKADDPNSVSFTLAEINAMRSNDLIVASLSSICAASIERWGSATVALEHPAEIRKLSELAAICHANSLEKDYDPKKAEWIYLKSVQVLTSAADERH